MPRPISENEVTMLFHKRAHNPLLIACDFPKTDIAVPRLPGKQLRLKSGLTLHGVNATDQRGNAG